MPAQRFLHSDAAGSYAPPRLSAPAPKMNYIHLLNDFWQLDAQERVPEYATRLYFFLVQECNRGLWQNPFTLSDRELGRAMGGSVNTLKKHRDYLVERGLITYQGGGKGRGDACVYALQAAEAVAPLKVSKSDTIPPKKVSKSDTLPAQKVSVMVSKSDTIPAEKVSDFDTYTIKEDKTSSVVETENEEDAHAPASSSPASKSEIVSSPTASHHPVPGTEGGRAAGRRESLHADEAQLTTAEQCPLLNEPAVFKAACLDLNPDYAGLDFEHYRLEMRFDALGRSLRLMPFEWRNRLRNWLSNARQSKHGLVLAAVPGQTLGDTRAIKPLAARSSASPTKAQTKSWS